MLRRLPEPYAEAIRLHDSGQDDAIAERLGIESESVGPLIEVAEAKLARLLEQHERLRGAR
jgi:DNA-directed RNA polymerase specialized sigma24 family protein